MVRKCSLQSGVDSNATIRMTAVMTRQSSSVAAPRTAHFQGPGPGLGPPLAASAAPHSQLEPKLFASSPIRSRKLIRSRHTLLVYLYVVRSLLTSCLSPTFP